MSPENKKELWQQIVEAGEVLKGRLPPSNRHPKGRNPYAHVAICIKTKFNSSYKDIPDEKYNEVINFIEFLKQNPS